MPDAFLLGAGFSKAICDRMPTLAELSTEIVPPGALAILDRDFGPDLETWLTYLAEDQPWLSQEQVLKNHAEFLGASKSIARVLLRRQAEALASPIPPWLTKLIEYWHENQCAVITLNYDTLVEKAYMAVIPGGGRPDHHEIYTASVPEIAWRLGMGGTRPRVEPTLRLMKLHGSINWCYSGQPSFYGETIWDLGLNSGMGSPWSAWAAEPEDDLSVKAPDKVNLIVPPTSTKSQFFQNEMVRHQWRNAYEELTRADAVYCIGYSLPVTDQLVRFMLATASGPLDVVPVNTDLAAFDRYRDLLPSHKVDAAYVGGADPISRLVSERLKP
jgi:NAD-dependent SIR2 family protein deacetylase